MRIKTIAFGLSLLALTAPAALAQSSPRQTMLVSADWLKAHVEDPDLVILHVGDRKEYDAGHIEGARYLPMDGLAVSQAGDLTLEMLAPEELRKQISALGISGTSKVVVYFTRGMIPGATRVVFTLDAAGLGDHVSLLDGGLPEWQRLAYPLTTAAPTVTPAKLGPLHMKPSVVDAKTVQDHLKAPGYRIIDARAAMFYDGVQAGGMAADKHALGHIAGAGSIPFTAITGPDGKLKPADELEAAFKAAGVSRGDKLMVYCHVGWQGTVVVFAARSLGIDASLYDGSFQDWSHRKLPVETVSAKP